MPEVTARSVIHELPFGNMVGCSSHWGHSRIEQGHFQTTRHPEGWWVSGTATLERLHVRAPRRAPLSVLVAFHLRSQHPLGREEEQEAMRHKSGATQKLAGRRAKRPCNGTDLITFGRPNGGGGETLPPRETPWWNRLSCSSHQHSDTSWPTVWGVVVELFLREPTCSMSGERTGGRRNPGNP